MSINANGQFRSDELVTRKMKVNGEWQSRTFPVVGGRLRIVHESNENLSILTEIVRLESDGAVVRATVETPKGKFNGTGTATAQRDARLADSLIELAETRAIARSLRFGGIGVEYTGAEEVSHVSGDNGDEERSTDKTASPALSTQGGNGKQAANVPRNGNGAATQAQIRALHALTRKARYTDEDMDSLLRPLSAASFDELTKESASQLITYLQTEAGQFHP